MREQPDKYLKAFLVWSGGILSGGIVLYFLFSQAFSSEGIIPQCWLLISLVWASIVVGYWWGKHKELNTMFWISLRVGSTLLLVVVGVTGFALFTHPEVQKWALLSVVAIVLAFLASLYGTYWRAFEIQREKYKKLAKNIFTSFQIMLIPDSVATFTAYGGFLNSENLTFLIIGSFIGLVFGGLLFWGYHNLDVEKMEEEEADEVLENLLERVGEIIQNPRKEYSSKDEVLHDVLRHWLNTKEETEEESEENRGVL